MLWIRGIVSMHIQVSDPTNADPMDIDGDVTFDSDDTQCTITIPIDSPITSRLMMSGLRKYHVHIDTGPGMEWIGTLTRWRVGGNRVYLYCMGDVTEQDD